MPGGKLIKKASLEEQLSEVLEEQLSTSEGPTLPDLSDPDLLSRAAGRAGVDARFIRKLEQAGKLDMWLSMEFFRISAVCAQEFEDAVLRGEVSPQVMANASIKFAEMGLKLSGRDVKKVAVLHGDLLERAASEAHREAVEKAVEKSEEPVENSD